MFSKDVERLTGDVDKMLEFITLPVTVVDNVRHVRGQYKLHSVSEIQYQKEHAK